MNHIYNWKINKLECTPLENNLENVVKMITWTYEIDCDGIKVNISNNYPLPSPTPEEYIEYYSLTEGIVIQWLESYLDVGYLQKYLLEQVKNLCDSPILSLPLPWQIEDPVMTDPIPVLTPPLVPT